MKKREVIVWAVSVFLLIGAAAPLAAQDDGTAKAADPRVTKALDEIGYKHRVTSLGNCRLEFNLGEDRGQVVFVSSKTETYDGLETRRMWSTVAKLEDLPSPEIMSKLLMDNLKQKLGAFELIQLDGGGYKVSYAAKVPVECSPSSLRAAIRMVIHSADAKEKELTGKDDY